MGALPIASSLIDVISEVDDVVMVVLACRISIGVVVPSSLIMVSLVDRSSMR